MNKSPINYMGSKRRLMDQLLPLFPNNINTFYDLFAGSMTVSLNVEANHYLVNDLDSELINMFNDLANLENDELATIRYDLNKFLDKQYFLKTRDIYNNFDNLEGSTIKSVILYELITCSFNGIPRFNKKGEYNIPYASKKRIGTNTFMDNKMKLLNNFIKVCKNRDIDFESKSYSYFLSFAKQDDFIYLDPPYWNTSATYNDGSGKLSWNDKDEQTLYQELTKIKDKTRFALSNVLVHHGQVNPYLTKFIKDNHLHVYHLNMNYSNSTYHTKNKDKSDEVLVTNY